MIAGKPILQVLVIGGVLGAGGKGWQEDEEAGGEKPRTS